MIYIAIFFEFVLYVVMMSLVMSIFAYFVMFIFGISELFGDFTEWVVFVIWDTFHMTVSMWLALLVNSFFLFFASIKLLQRRNKVYVAVVTGVNFVLLMLFLVSMLIETRSIGGNIYTKIVIGSLFGIAGSLMGTLSVIFSWRSFMSRNDAVLEEEERKKNLEVIRKKRKDDTFYDDMERSYLEKYPVRSFEEEYYPDRSS